MVTMFYWLIMVIQTWQVIIYHLPSICVNVMIVNNETSEKFLTQQQHTLWSEDMNIRLWMNESKWILISLTWDCMYLVLVIVDSMVLPHIWNFRQDNQILWWWPYGLGCPSMSGIRHAWMSPVYCRVGKCHLKIY